MDYSRRSILKGLTLSAGASLFSPYVNSLYAGEKGEIAPKRFVFVVKASGLDNRHLTPSKVGRHKSSRTTQQDIASCGLPKIFDSLAGLEDKVTIIRGLSGQNLHGNHTAGYGALSCVSSQSKAMATTIDAYLGTHHSTGPFRMFGMATNGYPLHAQVPPEDSYVYPWISAYKKGQGIAFQASPTKAYRQLFGTAVMSQRQLNNDAILKRNTLDFLKEDAKRIRRRLSSEDKDSFDSYLDAFDSLRVETQRKAALKDSILANTPEYQEDKYTSSQHMPRMEAQFELGTAALIAGLTNVVTLRPDTLGTMYQGLGTLGKGVHHIGHGGTGNGIDSSEAREKIDAYHLSLIAKMAKRFASIKEGSGTMLDNTIIVYLSCTGSAHHGGQNDWPAVLVGGMGDKIKTGQYLQLASYGNQGHQHLSNLYLSLIEASGMNTPETFGHIDSALRDLKLKGPIPELMG